LAQKGIALLHRLGATQHWDGSWDTPKAYTATLKKFWLAESLVRLFIEQRSSFSFRLVDMGACLSEASF
jgi:hypothetical protein